MIGKLTAFFTIALELIAFQPSHGDETKVVIDEVIGKLKLFKSQWNEGYLSGTVRGDDGYADLKLWWVGDRSRREVINYGIDGKREPVHLVYTINRQTTCTFNPDSLVANCNRRIIQPEIPSLYRILPGEAWVEILPTRTISSWLTAALKSPGNQRALKAVRVSNEYVVLTGPLDAVERCSVAIESRQPLPSLDEGEYVTQTTFNSAGLMTSSGYVGSPNSNAIRMTYTWTDDRPPKPFVLLRQATLREETEFRVMVNIKVLESFNQLPKDAPSMSVPPNDLPFGTHVMDRTGAKEKNYFIGGAEGQIAAEMRRSGKAIRKVLDK